MPNKKKPGIHTVPHGGKWANIKEGNKRESSVHNTQAEAAKAGRETARKGKTEHYIHNRQGEIRERNSYGNDPNPPKDKR
jgi:hypothetical protein